MSTVKGNIVKLSGGPYEYEIPLKEPSDEKDIINFDQPRSEQFWHIPSPVNVKNLSAKDRINFIERERQRWEEGVYVLIDGMATYITGMMYDHMTYMTFKSGNAEYMDHQRHDFYFKDLVRKDNRCKGKVTIKPRRYGASMQECTEATYSLLENFSNNVGLQSDTKDKVKTTLLMPIIQSYVKRPKYMRSDYYKPNGKLLVSELNLSSNMAPGDDGEEKGDYLLGWLKGFPSLPRSMDGNEMGYIIQDECWKWQESSPKETLESNIKVLMGRNRAGKISLLSTMGDSDDYVRAVMDGCDIIAKSNPMVRDDNGFTVTGLYEWFVSAVYSFDIPPHIFEINKFGKVNVDKHLEYIHNTLAKLDKNSKSYVFEKRRMPLTKEDALMSAQMSTNFRRVVINSRLTELRGMLPDQKRNVYIRCNLEEDRNGKVYLKYDPEGIWMWSVQPYFSAEKNIDTRNRFRKINNVLFPPVNPEGAIGYDPINYHANQTTSTHLSRAAAVIRKKFDYFNKPDDKDYCVDSMMAMLLYRPDDPHDANKEVMKACRFTGYPCMHEKSVSHVYDDFLDANMLPFLLKDAKGAAHGISPSDMKAKKDGLAMLQTRYAVPKSDEERDQLAEYPFEEGLTSLDNFDIGDTTPYDPTMAEIYCEHGLKQILFTNMNDQSHHNFNRIVNEIFAPRNN